MGDDGFILLRGVAQSGAQRTLACGIQRDCGAICRVAKVRREECAVLQHHNWSTHSVAIRTGRTAL